ncbi:Retrovirus-related Pol polyprotein from transposon TNT 1-94 [Abeliophyllum distichum]|uniref:Retrovirus-related Pol polyprotein from transposon TNT 1-94 n=1 Tax=Abeliophyllum distichum TaxID=126358 RepID=A0ABD1SDF3_9LAMI
MKSIWENDLLIRSITSVPSAYTACPNSVEDQAWYADTGASHHVTSDKNNVDEAREYTGKQKMVVSVSKLTNDNNVSVEFFPRGCVVKDLPTRRALMQEKLEDGLYQLNSLLS